MTTKFLDQFTKFISLGSNCFCRKFFEYKGKQKETNFFDNVGVSMWALNEIIQNDFKDVLNRDYFVNKRINKKKDEYIYTNELYYLIFKHDFVQSYKKGLINISDTSFSDFKSKYERRIERFRELINKDEESDKDIYFFLRYEEYRDQRIIHEEYEDKFATSELDYLEEFSFLLKEKNPLKKFVILYITRKDDEKNKCYVSDNIIVLKNYLNISWANSDEMIEKLCKENEKFLETSIKEILNLD
jgi:hypothetical protein